MNNKTNEELKKDLEELKRVYNHLEVADKIFLNYLQLSGNKKYYQEKLIESNFAKEKMKEQISILENKINLKKKEELTKE